MERVIITRRMVGAVAMQVCADRDATDEEILNVCNIQNPSGTSNGWVSVVREVKEDNPFYTKYSLPVPCGDNPETRLHFIVLC